MLTAMSQVLRCPGAADPGRPQRQPPAVGQVHPGQGRVLVNSRLGRQQLRRHVVGTGGNGRLVRSRGDERPQVPPCLGGLRPHLQVAGQQQHDRAG